MRKPTSAIAASSVRLRASRSRSRAAGVPLTGWSMVDACPRGQVSRLGPSGHGEGSGVVRAVQSLEALGEVGLEILDVLQPDMDAQQVLALGSRHGGAVLVG